MIGKEEKAQRALVTYVVAKVAEERPIGKKALQKYLHILNDVAKVDTGYNFSIYTYGPFSRSLAAEIDSLDNSKALSVIYNETNGSFEITVGEKADRTIAAGEEFLKQNEEKIDKVLHSLKGRSAFDLELYSTLVFLRTHVEGMNDDVAVVEKLRSLKPKYPLEKVESTLTEVKSALSG